MKTLIPAASRCSLIFTAVAALSLAYPASVQAFPTTYHYRGNHFTDVSGPYTTSMFVRAMVTLADPLPPNFNGSVTPTAFTLSDGVQTITNFGFRIFVFQTDAFGAIVNWDAHLLFSAPHTGFGFNIETSTTGEPFAFDTGSFHSQGSDGAAFNEDMPGSWRIIATPTPDAGSTLSLLTLTLMALALAARRFQRGAG